MAGTNRLLTHAVADSSARAWSKRVRTFLSDVKKNDTPFETFQQRDAALADYMADLCFLERSGYSAGVQLLAGFCHFFPEHRGQLPLSSRAVSSWLRLASPLEGGPVAPEALGLMALGMVRAGMFQSALVLLLSFDAFFRSHDAFGICKGDLNYDGKLFSIAVGRRDRGASAKTGTDQGVVLDRTWLGWLLWFWQQDLVVGESFWSLDASRYRKDWGSMQRALGLEGIGPAHSVRHSGPALQAMQGRRSLEEIRRRGRWKSLNSVQRYTKAHKLVEARARLDDDQRRTGLSFFDDPVAASRGAARSAPPCGERDRFLALLKMIPRSARIDDTLEPLPRAHPPANTDEPRIPDKPQDRRLPKGS